MQRATLTITSAVMQVVSQAYIYPSVAATIAMKESGMTLQQRWQEFPFIVSDMLFPLLIGKSLNHMPHHLS